MTMIERLKDKMRKAKSLHTKVKYEFLFFSSSMEKSPATFSRPLSIKFTVNRGTGGSGALQKSGTLQSTQ